MTENMRKFIREHAGDDVVRLLLEASRGDAGIDMRFACGQIAARQRIKDKLPSWYADDAIVIPSTLAAEQCSSEQTAAYKQRLVERDDAVCDLTGGLGVDAYFLSRKARCVTYVERNGDYCQAARHNMAQLGADNVAVVHAGASEAVAAGLAAAANVFYLDPARRGVGNKRVFALQDCEPDVTALWPALRGRGARVIVKLSPMLDISRVLAQLPDVREVHVVAVGNECRELLAVACDAPPEEVNVCCVNFTPSGEEQRFCFGYDEEALAEVSCAAAVQDYLYEPNASLLKAGAYRTVAARYGVEKLHPNSHLYTSGTYLPAFAGRTFAVKRVYPFDKRLCRDLRLQLPQANITVRNFPLSVYELRLRTRIADGGETYLFATTLHTGKRVLIECRKS